MSEPIPSLLKRLEQDHLLKGLNAEQEKALLAQVFKSYPLKSP